MFSSSRRLWAKPPVRRYSKNRPFVDRVKILLASGAGGDGASIMGALMNNEFAGPMGGNGGKGGDLFVRSSKSVQDLAHIADLGSQVVAESGHIGYNQLCAGRKGQSLELVVPLGTQIVDVDTNQIVVDLDNVDMKVLLLEGGQGGKGNANFVNSIIHSPKEATRGLPGNTMLANIELKLVADCGLVGYPNAGKSSLLNAISTSRPQIANYPFTTLNPYVGQVHDLYGQSCSIADLPGIIEGAYENRGLGHQFLRHVERTTAIAFVIDMYSPFVPSDSSITSALAAAASLEASEMYAMHAKVHAHLTTEDGDGGVGGESPASAAEGGASSAAEEEPFADYAKKNPHQFADASSFVSEAAAADNPLLLQTKVTMQEPWEVLETLQNELEFYLPGLSEKGLVVFANKMDYEFDSAGNPMKAKLEELRRRTHLPVFAVSAKNGIEYGTHHHTSGLSEPLNHITRYVHAAKKAHEEANSSSSKQLDDELESIFRGRNTAHFTPVDFTTWRAQVKSSTGGFSSFDGTHDLTDNNSPLFKGAFDNKYAHSATGSSQVWAGGAGEEDETASGIISQRVTAEEFVDAEAPPISASRNPQPSLKRATAASSHVFGGSLGGAISTGEHHLHTSSSSATAVPAATMTDIGIDAADLDFDDAEDPFGDKLGDADEDPFAGSDDAAANSHHQRGEGGGAAVVGGLSDDDILNYYNADLDPLKEHRLLRDGGLRTTLAASQFKVGGAASAAAARDRMVAVDAVSGHELDTTAIDIDEEVEGPIVPVDDMTLSNTRLLGGIAARRAAAAGLMVGTASAAAKADAAAASAAVAGSVSGNLNRGAAADSKSPKSSTLGNGRAAAASPPNAGFFLRRAPKKAALALPTLSARGNSGGSASGTPATEISSSGSSNNTVANRNRSAAAALSMMGGSDAGGGVRMAEASEQRRRANSALPSQEVLGQISALVGGGGGHGASAMGAFSAHTTTTGVAGATTSFTAAALALGSGGGEDFSSSSSSPSAPPMSPAVRAAREAAMAAARHALKRSNRESTAATVGGGDYDFTTGGGGPLRSKPLQKEEMSLVDQQLGDAVGQSGYGEAFDSYKHLPGRSKFHSHRDTSLRGQHWRRTRLPGEKLADEKWH